MGYAGQAMTQVHHQRASNRSSAMDEWAHSGRGLSPNGANKGIGNLVFTPPARVHKHQCFTYHPRREEPQGSPGSCS
jgi:hypothetical protein